MKHLNDEQITKISELLDQRAADLRGDLERESNDKASYLDIATEIHDPGQASFANLEVDLGHAERTRDVNELKSIDEARERIKDGSYGQCIDCGVDIPFERLLAQPTALRCVRCQELYEKTYANAGQGPRM